MEFNDLAGDLTIDMSDLQKFVRGWYRPEDLVAVTGIRPSKNRQGVLSMAVPVKDLMTWTEEDIWGLAKRKDGTVYGAYVTLFPILDASKVTSGKRGDKSNVGKIYGTFIDFDVKPGAFESREAVEAFLTEGEVPKPTLLIQNGTTGGLHGYWRLQYEDDDKGYEELLAKFWAFIQSKSPVKIDRLIDSTRLSRLPSSVYWPKEGTEGIPGVVKTIWADGPKYSLQELEDLTKEAWDDRKQRVSRVIDEDSKMKLDASLLAADLGVGGDSNMWSLYAAISAVQENFNELYTWENILQPLGWTYLKTDSQGREEYARPGRFEKSATVNWPESKDMMSLLSESPETGLADLKEAGIALTKYRVALRLLWNDDPQQMTKDIVNQMNGQS